VLQHLWHGFMQKGRIGGLFAVCLAGWAR